MACSGVGLGVGLNSWGEELWLLYSKLLVRGVHGVTDRASLNWLFGVSCTVLVLSSDVGSRLYLRFFSKLARQNPEQKAWVRG